MPSTLAPAPATSNEETGKISGKIGENSGKGVMMRPKQGRKPQCSVRRYETDGRSISFPSFSYSIYSEPITLASVSHPICQKPLIKHTLLIRSRST